MPEEGVRRAWPSRALKRGSRQGLIRVFGGLVDRSDAGAIQDALEQEGTEFLGRARSVRQSEPDRVVGCRIGYVKRRKLTLSSGTIEARRPRLRQG